MHTINGLNTLAILEHISNSSRIDRDTFTVIITGRIGPTGKTWLCQQLRKLGYSAGELNPSLDCLSVKDDGVNHVVEDYEAKQVVVVLNQILPMYRNKYQIRDLGKLFEKDKVIYIFDGLAYLKDVFTRMQNIAEADGFVTRAEFMRCVHMRFEDADTKHGWTTAMLKKARMREHKDGFFIEFPKAIYLG